MEIIKPGRPERAKKERQFRCQYCECEFLAELKDFHLEGWALAGTLHYEAVCRCPDCGAECRELLEE